MINLEKLRKKLVYVAYKKTDQWEDAEDIAHDAFLETLTEMGVEKEVLQSNKFSKKLFKNMYKTYYHKLQEKSRLLKALRTMQETEGVEDAIREQLENEIFPENTIGDRLQVRIRESSG